MSLLSLDYEKKCNIGQGVQECAYRAPMDSKISPQAMLTFAEECVQYTMTRYNVSPRASIRIKVKGYVDASYRWLSTELMRIRDYSREKIGDVIAKAMNSDETFRIAMVYVCIVNANVQGSGRMSTQPRRKGVGAKSVISVPSFRNDHSCGPRALVQACIHKDRKTHPQDYNRLRRQERIKNRSSKECEDIFTRAQELCALSSVDFNTPTPYSDLVKLARGLSLQRGRTCHIRVWNEEKGMSRDFTTLSDDNIRADPEAVSNYEFFDLVYKDQHYDVMLKNNILLGNQRKFCDLCNKTYSHNHTCRTRCSMCNGPQDHFSLYIQNKQEKETRWRRCGHCMRSFYTDDCFDRHQAGGVNSACNTLWKCRACKNKFFWNERDPDDHKCGEIRCKNCSTWNLPNDPTHQCYMQKRPPRNRCSKYIFADVECTQDTGEHIVNLVCTYEHKSDESALIKWEAYTTIDAWLDRVLSEQYMGSTVIFHNGQGYDFIVILNRLLQRRLLTLRPTMVGSKVLYFILTHKLRFRAASGLRFVDSLNFLLMPLSAFTKTFGLTTKKGYFPHLFNTQANQTYVGPIPDEKYFMPDNMTDATYRDFKQWHQEQLERPWDFQHEFVAYCEADALLLAQGCLKYREIVMQATPSQHDPLQETTLASSAMQIFRTSMLEENTIAALPNGMIRELRPAFCGGRTGATKLWFSCSPQQRIQYVDFTSLYPYINKYGLYPVGHPIIYTAAAWPPMNQGLSIWHVDVKCPQDLYHPLLHSKTADTQGLTFDLRDKEKQLYTNLELKYAVAKFGYRITKIYKVWLWPETRRGLFADYINSFLKLKQEAAGWPKTDMTDEEKDAYIADYLEHEGILLDRIRIAANKGLYSVAKMYLNSLWGKFGQRLRDEFTQTLVLHDTEDGHMKFNRLHASGELKDLNIVNEHTIIVQHRQAKANDTEVCDSANIPIAIFTTSQARLHLYKHFLEPLGERVLYYDTDSCIFWHDAKEDPMKLVRLGPHLGDPTNELDKKGTCTKTTYGNVWIQEFRSGGPKNYSYRLSDGVTTVVKVKGISTGKRYASSLLGFETMSSAIQSDNKIELSFGQLVRNKDYEIHSVQAKKTYRCYFTKRATLPMERDERGKVKMIDTRPWNQSDEITRGKNKKTPSKKRKRCQIEKSKTISKTWCCYLLKSVSSHERYYIGYTDDPFVRLRKHNGEISGGATETIVGRPWCIMLYITGYSTRSEATTCEYIAQRGSLNDDLCAGFTNFTPVQQQLALYLYHIKGMPGLTVKVRQTSEHLPFIQQFIQTHGQGVTLSLYQ